MLFNCVKVMRLHALIERRLRSSSPVAESPASPLAGLVNELAEFPAAAPLPAELKARWVKEMVPLAAAPRQRSSAALGVRIAVPALLLLLAVGLLFSRPVQVVFAQLLGYGYTEETGFFKLSTSSLLSQPVTQEHEGESLTVVNGLANPTETRLWVHSSAAGLDYSGVWLETAAGTRLPVQHFEVTPTGETQLAFAPLPGPTLDLTLVFPAGWHLPLHFLSGSEWRQQTSGPGRASTPSAAPSGASACVAPLGYEVCVQGAAYSSEGVQILLVSGANHSPFTPPGVGSIMGLAAANPLSGDDQATLSVGEEQASISLSSSAPAVQQNGGNVEQTLTLALPANIHGEAKLTLPALTASLALAEPVRITVDLGTDPQPGQSVALPADIQISGHTLHFVSASISGDGVNSLRLTLVSAPQEAENGWVVSGLELGRPEGIADRYGSSSIDSEGRLQVFSELFSDDGQIKTGKLELPVVAAEVLLPGPFTFTFPLPDAVAAAAQPTTTVVSGDSFAAQPSATALAMNTYRSTGATLQADDLLFTVVHATTSDLYAQSAQAGATPQLIATLPGQVAQVHIQRDRQGIDYLTGTRVDDSTQTNFLAPQLFSLRFAESQPRLLAVFPTGPSSLPGGGTLITSVSWSADDRILAFILGGLQSAEGNYVQKAGWVNLDCRDSGDCPLQYFDLPEPVEGFYAQQFSPLENVLIYSTTVSSPNYGDIDKLYQVTFDANGQPGEAMPVTQLDSAAESNPRWLPDGNSLLLTCEDMGSADVNNLHLCLWNLTTGQRTDLLDLNQYVEQPPMRNFELSPQGDLLAAGGRNGIQLFNRVTRESIRLPYSDYLSKMDFDAAGTTLYVLGNIGKNIEAIDLDHMVMRNAFTLSGEGNISWIGVVR
jgi:hypothetical protein